MIKYLLKSLIRLIRPLLGPNGSCCYALPCSDYAFMQLDQKPLLIASWMIAKRVISCNPLSQFLYRR